MLVVGAETEHRLGLLGFPAHVNGLQIVLFRN